MGNDIFLRQISDMAEALSQQRQFCNHIAKFSDFQTNYASYFQELQFLHYYKASKVAEAISVGHWFPYHITVLQLND